LTEILSQSEIDELLAALASGDDSVKEQPSEDKSGEARSYNFKTANKFSKEQIRMLNFIYENFSGRLSTYLSGTLRVVCDVEVVSVEEQTFAEYNNSLPVPAFLAIFNMPPLAGSSILELSSAVSFEIISRLFGGKGQFAQEHAKPYTDIEIAILTRVMRQMLSVMNESWERVVTVRTSLDRIETSSQFAQIVAGSEPTIIITINVKIGDVSDLMNICIPHIAIQPIAKLLAKKALYDDRISDTEAAEFDFHSASRRIQDTAVTLHTVFDTTTATIRDILHLKTGDVIRINHPLNRKVTVMVEHMPKFRGELGIQGKHMALKISEIMKEAAEDG
jgi:flagellar motor switch protein FliM